MAKLNDQELQALVSQRFTEAQGSDYAELTTQRERALNYYYGRPLGNEIEGRSQVVSKDMMDTVEWAMPSLMRIFTTKNAVQFDPVGPEDEELAKQETEYVGHVFWKQNNGFMNLHSWLKDGIMQRAGYMMYWWEETEKTCVEEYTGLSQDQAAQLIQDLEQESEVEVTGAEFHQTAPGVPQAIDLRLKITKKQGRLRIEPIPPDEVVVSADCRGGIKNAKFAGRLKKMTRSDLMEEGYSRAEVEAVTDYSWPQSNLSQARNVDGAAQEQSDPGVDWATKELTLLDCFTTVDVDDDGYAEMRHFLQHGSGFLRNEDADEIQMCSWTPIPMPHQHVGIDFYDLTEDTQRINTGLTRSLLDNAYFGNNHRLAYNKNTVNVNMLQINRPGGHVAVDGPPAGEVYPIPVSDVGVRLLPVIQHFQQIRDARTGVGAMINGVDADVLAQSTKGAYMDAKGAANQRLEAIARVFAETGLSDLYSSIHRMLLKHQDWPTRFKIKNSWVEVNPAEWQERANLSVSVGLGNAGREEIRANLGAMAQAQIQAAATPGLIQPKNVYALFRRMQVELGLEAEDLITDPSTPEFANATQQGAPPPDPYVEGKKIDAQVKLQTQEMQSRDKTLDRNQDRDLKVTELEVKSGVDLAKAGIGAEVSLSRGSRPPGSEGAGVAQQQPVQ